MTKRKRTPSSDLPAKIRRMLKGNPMRADVLASKTVYSYPYVMKVLQRMYRDGELVIAGWEHSGQQKVRLLVLKDEQHQQDVPFPKKERRRATQPKDVFLNKDGEPIR